jgi:hypothetical protein
MGTQRGYSDLLVRTRAGKKVHLSSTRSVIATCGLWLKGDADTMAFPKASVVEALKQREEQSAYPSTVGPASVVLCERCFPRRRARRSGSSSASTSRARGGNTRRGEPAAAEDIDDQGPRRRSRLWRDFPLPPAFPAPLGQFEKGNGLAGASHSCTRTAPTSEGKAEG